MDNYQKLKFNVLFEDIFLFYRKAYVNSFDNFRNDFINKYYPDFSLDDDLIEIIDQANLDDSSIDSNDYLTSIFSKISLNNKSNKKYYITPNKLVLNDSIFPKKDLNNNFDFKSLWDDFIEEFDLIKNHEDFNTVLALLRKYFSLICYKEDISLFDHLKITNAISNCLYLNNSSNFHNKPFIIINGDISGIQKFIFKNSSLKKSQKGMSKRLRGRSLYLSLLTESLANKLIVDLDLDLTNILFCAGGRFTIISPNTPHCLEVIENLKFKINKKLIEKFNAELYLSLVNIDVSFEDLHDFNLILSKLNFLTKEDKTHKFVDHLYYLFNDDESFGNNICPYCGKSIENNRVCDNCNYQEKLGAAVVNSKYLIVFKGFDESSFSICGNNYLFKGSDEEVIDFLDSNFLENVTVYKLNDTNFLDIVSEVYTKNVSFDFKFIGNTIPSIGNDLLIFDHLGKISKGLNNIGVLKMDVDNLGEIFYKGIYDEYLKSNIYKVSSLSTFLDIFFSGIINNIAKKFRVYTYCGEFKESFEEIKLDFGINGIKSVFKPNSNYDVPIELEQFSTSTLYISYSSGDDLLIVGPYDDVICFALEFREKFKQWTGYNESINISAGIGIFNYNFPIGNAVIQSELYLNQSKKCGKDKITILNQTLSWEDIGEIIGFNNLFNFSKKLEILYDENKIPRSFIYSLLNIWVQNEKFLLERTNDEIKDEESWYNYNLYKVSSNFFVPIYYNSLKKINNTQVQDDLAMCYKFIPWVKLPVFWANSRVL